MLSDSRIEAIARVTHEANRAYCQTLGDNSQVSWDEAPQWQRDSAIMGVKFALTPKTKLGGNDDAAQHNAWLSQKLRDGWRYGPVKDPENKVHPCLLPYDELPEAQKLKDKLFRIVVGGLLTDEDQKEIWLAHCKTSQAESGVLGPNTMMAKGRA